ncbi:hypothetical protein [uncultured Roseobacter sp.]|uniref:hypothetical protein n=1 Tax=uncultured Roseobacter sp. TaxID=114847 RepID=UPI0026128D50|nr:hypothetical protein [uncultured Roseobacter sp.]
MDRQASDNFRIYTVHGTWAEDPKKNDEGPRWWQRGSDFSEALLTYLDCNRVSWQPFHWNGLNTGSARISAGNRLYEDIERIAGTTDGPTPVFLCHSHGGNLFAHATFGFRGARERQGRPWPPAITVGTPYLSEVPVSLPLVSIRVALFGLLFALLWGLRLFSDTEMAATVGPILALVVTSFLILALFPESAGRFAYNRVRNLPGLNRAKALLLGLFDRFNAKSNAARPKLFVAADEAITGLKLAHNRNLTIATPETMVYPVTLVLAGLGCVILWFVRDILPPVLISDLVLIMAVSENQSDLREVLVQTVDFAADLVLLGPFVLFASWLAAWGISPLAARVFNRILSSVVRQRAFGRDSWASGVFDVPADDNLPLVSSDYAEGARWQPLPDSFATELDKRSAAALSRSASQIRASLAPVLLAGDGSELKALLQGGIDWDLLVHTVYFSHPDMPGFLAWMLVELYGLPPSSEYDSLPHAKFREWYVHIAPDGAPMPGL